MKQRKISFRLIFLIYILLLAALVTAAVLYVRALLFDYEQSQPELQAENAVTQLISDAHAGDFWAKYRMPDISSGPFEQSLDIQAEYLALYEEDKLAVTQRAGTGDELFYTVERDGFPLAEIKLKAAGPAVTKLAVLTLREWNVESVTPILNAQNYTLTVPNSFSVQVNGIPLTSHDGTPNGERQTEYTVSGLYLKPEFTVTDRSGNEAAYTLKNNRVLVEFFDYALTLPAALTVEVNETVLSGETAGEGLLHYEITTLTKPTVYIRDDYGNVVNYEGGSDLPLTRTNITADSRCAVRVNGASVPAHRVVSRANPEYTLFAEFVPNLPTICDYTIAVLQDDADLSVTDPLGNAMTLEGGQTEYDLTGCTAALSSVPDEVAAQVDVLQTAQNWSMFMTDDLPFAQIESALISGSYQHKVAVKYATGVDIKYTSKHTLADPAFTENSVTNFVWITEDCFSVDISFVKHMRLYYGAMVDDPMNDRFYFVRYDDTDNGITDPAWKLAGMKEIV